MTLRAESSHRGPARWPTLPTLDHMPGEIVRNRVRYAVAFIAEHRDSIPVNDHDHLMWLTDQVVQILAGPDYATVIAEAHPDGPAVAYTWETP